MFLPAMQKRNPDLIEAAFFLHQRGQIQPDTYLIDLDTLRENAQAIKAAADTAGLSLYFMLKQMGRNPKIGHLLAQLGYAGAVSVDYREALTLMRDGVKIGHVGHLVQIPKSILLEILKAKPEVITVFSLEKAKEISDAALSLHQKQKILLRVIGEQDIFYPGQTGGFPLQNLPQTIDALQKMPGIQISGVCTFPGFLYDEKTEDFAKTPNVKTVQEAKAYLLEQGYSHLQINLPSGTCSRSIALIAKEGGTHGEPGHSLTGTTPYHVSHWDAPERPAYVYVSEISHCLGQKSYSYGGGRYPRGHLKNALVGSCFQNAKQTTIIPPPDDNIDYYFELDGTFPVSQTVIMAARTQIFVTRSEVALVEGLSLGKPVLNGIYTAQGQRIR